MKDRRLESDYWHPHTICPGCRSQVRQRLFWASLDRVPSLGLEFSIRQCKVLHFAPDECLTERIRKRSGEYVTADLLEEGYHYESIDLNIDISNMSQIADESYDCVIALDVLEHVRDDRKAIAEVNRVLTKEGCCIFMIPQKDHQRKTLEDMSQLTKEERTEKFGQWDHWRIYGSDFKDMLEDAGFEVLEVSAEDFDKEVATKNVLYPPVQSSHPLATNNRRVYYGRKKLHLMDEMKKDR